MTLVADYNPSVSVPFQRMRALLLDSGGGLQEGVVGPTDFEVGPRAAGANMTVDIPAGAAWVQIDTGTRNGLGHVYNDATANVALTSPHATLPRLDQAVLRWNDSSIPTGSGNTPTLEIIAGTATSGATLDNRLGAASLPNDCMRLADILVAGGGASIGAAAIRDRRPWARGLRWSSSYTAGNFTAFAAPTLIVAAMNPRLELSGGEVIVQLAFTYVADATARILSGRVQVDAATIMERDATVPASGWGSITMNEPYTPGAPGSKVFAFQLGAGVAAGTVQANGINPISASVMEVVRPNTNNT